MLLLVVLLTGGVAVTASTVVGSYGWGGCLPVSA
jgi:hypothetical protein